MCLYSTQLPALHDRHLIPKNVIHPLFVACVDQQWYGFLLLSYYYTGSFEDNTFIIFTLDLLKLFLNGLIVTLSCLHKFYQCISAVILHT